MASRKCSKCKDNRCTYEEDEYCVSCKDSRNGSAIYGKAKRIADLFFYISSFLVFVLVLLLSGLLIKRQVLSRVPTRVGIVILGGGLQSNGDVPKHTILRLERAKELYFSLKKENPSQEVLLITLSGGTTHKPSPLDAEGFPIAESSSAAKVLINVMEIPTEHVLEEAFSLDTLGNAYFLRTVHLQNAAFDKLIVITNDWHMPRTRALFDFVFSLPGDTSCLDYFSIFHYFPLPSCTLSISSSTLISYESVGSGLSELLLAARKEREKASLVSFIDKVKPFINDMKQMHSFMFNKHSAYSTSRLTKKREKIDENVLKSY